MKLPPALDKLHKMKFAMPIGVVVALMVNIAIIATVFFAQIGGIGSYVMLIAIVLLTFFFFYVFGIRQLKWMIVFGIVIFLILGAFMTYFFVQTLYGEDPASVWSDDGTFTNGSVAPLVDTSVKSFVFTVDYGGSQAAENVSIQVVVCSRLYSDATVFVPMQNLSDSNTFQGSVQLTDAEVHSYYFQLRNGDWDNLGAETNDTYSYENWGPMTQEKGSVITALLPTGMILNGFCNIGMLFFIVVLLYWWMGKAKEQRKQWDETKEDIESEKETVVWKASDEKKKDSDGKKKEADFSCTSCGADVHDDDDKCPKCGEMFDDDEEDEEPGEQKEADFTCTECGADAYDEDEKCRNCGEPFEDDEDEEKPSEFDIEPADKEAPKEGYSFCPHCGKEIHASHNFCPHCGKPFEISDDD